VRPARRAAFLLLRPSGFLRTALLLLLTLASACGKKGDPQPPLHRGPRAVSDLAVEQEGGEAVLTFSFPDRLVTGQPLTDLEAIEIYRSVGPSPAVTAPRQVAPSGGTAGDRAPGAAARSAAQSLRLAEEAFYDESQRIAQLSHPLFSQHTQGAAIRYEDPLLELLAKAGTPAPLAYAVVSARRNGERSPLSNIALLSPEVPPAAPVILRVIPEEGRICLEWLAPEKDLLGRPVAVGGYRVYRRSLPEESYGAPLNAEPISGTSFVDATAPYGATYVYTLRATLPKKPRVEGLPAEEVGVEYLDIFAPAAPARLDVLSEGNVARLFWDPVAAPDLAGYVLFRAEGDAAPARLTEKPVTDTFFTDRGLLPARRYRYTVRAVDAAGNLSSPSPEAVAQPF